MSSELTEEILGGDRAEIVDVEDAVNVVLAAALRAQAGLEETVKACLERYVNEMQLRGVEVLISAHAAVLSGSAALLRALAEARNAGIL